MVTGDYVFAVFLIAMLYLLIHTVHWTGGHCWHHGGAYAGREERRRA